MSKTTNYSTINKQLEKQLKSMERHRHNLESQMSMIQSARAYKLWQSMNEIKPKKKQSQGLMPPSVVKSHKSNPNKHNKLKKVAFLTDRLLTGFGVDLVVHEQAQLLCQDYDLTVFSIAIEDDFIMNSNYKICRLPIPQRFNPIAQDMISVKYILKYKDYFQDFDTFVIHTPTYHSWVPFLKRFGKVVVYYYGNSPSNNYKGLKKYRQNLLNILENYVYFPHADRIASISEYLSTMLRKKNQKKTSVIRLAGSHMLSTMNHLDQQSQLQILKDYDFNSKEKYITYIGRLDYHNNPYKNTSLLMNIAKEIGAPEKYKVLGIGFPENNIQEELYEQGVYSVANATPEELATFLSHSYLYCSPSLWEGFNLPLLEAQTLGIPVVAFNLPAHQEIVKDGTTGFLVNSKGEMILKIQLLLNDEKLRHEMSENARKHAAEFSWEKNASQFSELL